MTATDFTERETKASPQLDNTIMKFQRWLTPAERFVVVKGARSAQIWCSSDRGGGDRDGWLRRPGNRLSR